MIFVTVISIGLFGYADWCRDSIEISRPSEELVSKYSEFYGRPVASTADNYFGIGTDALPKGGVTPRGIACGFGSQRKPLRSRTVPEPETIENILQISGDLQSKTRIVCALYEIRNGVAVDRTGFATGRHLPTTNEPWRENVDSLIAIATAQDQKGTPSIDSKSSRFVQLGCCGQNWSGGAMHTITIDFDLNHKEIYEGPIRLGQNLIAYAAGDAEFELNKSQSVDEFAAQNEGNFIVVWVGLKAASE